MQHYSAMHTLKLTTPLLTWRGDSLQPVTLAYETWGELNAEKSNAILLLTGLSPGAHAASSDADPEAGWWEDMLGPGKPIDSNRYFVVCVNSLGSCLGSTGPDSLNPATGKPWRLDFPELSIEDIATGCWKVVEHLGIEQLHCIIGPSMGGMTALALLKQYPQAARQLISISSTAAASPFAIAIRSLQREAIVTDPNWQNGHYSDSCWPISGMRMARKLGMISYRSAIEWQQRFDRQPQSQFATTVYGMNFQIEAYLEAHALKFIGQFDPCCYVYLSRAMDWFDASDRQHGDLSAMLSQTSLQSALIMGVSTDLLFPLSDQQTLADAMAKTTIQHQMLALDCVQGHDAFLIDSERFGPPIHRFLS